MAKKLSCRAAAARALQKVLAHGASLNSTLDEFGELVPERDQALLSQLCYGALRFYPRYTDVLKQLLRKPLKNKDQDVFALLILGCYQLDEMRVPDHAAISTVVEASKELKKPWAKGLINGVLRQYQRHREEFLAALSQSAKDAHPMWLANKLQTAWPENYSDIIAANNSHPPLCLRVNNQHQRRDNYLQLLQDAGQEASACTHATNGIRLASSIDVLLLPGFTEGWVSVQDEAAQLAGELLDIQSGMHVLDACAAPGGKTGNILELQPNLDLLALDSNERRLSRVQENLDRLRLSAKLCCGDASQPEKWWDGKHFDRILLDAPCSGSGVIRRHPDIKVLRRRDDIAQLAKQQQSILKALWPCLNGGGKLLYATCSVLPEENQEVIDSFLNEHPDAESVDIVAAWGTKFGKGRQLLPTVDGPDGFFYALLHKQ